MSSRRFGEHGHPPYRSKRLYRANGQWYFDTREGTQFGPFRTQEEAKNALAVFVALHVYEEAENGWRPAQNPSAQDGIDHLVQEIIEVLRCHVDFGPLAANTWIQSRLEDLELSKEQTPVTLERMDVLKYAMEYGQKLFDPSVFLENLA